MKRGGAEEAEEDEEGESHGGDYAVGRRGVEGGFVLRRRGSGVGAGVGVAGAEMAAVVSSGGKAMLDIRTPLLKNYEGDLARLIEPIEYTMGLKSPVRSPA